jgi:hypothetical protein
MFSEPRRKRRALAIIALVALLIALPAALSRPEASSASLSAVRLSADATEAQNPPLVDVDLWAGMPQAVERYEQQKIEYIQAVIAEQERQRAAAAAERKRKAAAAAAAKQRSAPRAAATAPTYAGGSVWDDLAQCESHGNWAINTGNGYYGGLQMDMTFWETYGNPAYSRPDLAPRGEQIAAATKARDSGRGYHPWPTCARKLGLID